MATSKLNPEQYKNLETNAKGVLLVYTDAKENKSAQLFFGEGYVPANKLQDEVFRVWRNIVTTFWKVKQEELGLRVANDGIRSKLRASTPTEIIFRAENGDAKRFELSTSVWSKIGLIPTKKDLERLVKERDFKASIHKAAKASFDALGFRVSLEKDEVIPVSAPIEQPVANVAEIAEVQPVEEVVEIVATTVEQPVVNEEEIAEVQPAEQSAETIEQPVAEMEVETKPANRTERRRRQRINADKTAA